MHLHVLHLLHLPQLCLPLFALRAPTLEFLCLSIHPSPSGTINQVTAGSAEQEEAAENEGCCRDAYTQLKIHWPHNPSAVHHNHGAFAVACCHEPSIAAQFCGSGGTGWAAHPCCCVGLDEGGFSQLGAAGAQQHGGGFGDQVIVLLEKSAGDRSEEVDTGVSGVSDSEDIWDHDWDYDWDHSANQESDGESDTRRKRNRGGDTTERPVAKSSRMAPSQVGVAECRNWLSAWRCNDSTGAAFAPVLPTVSGTEVASAAGQAAMTYTAAIGWSGMTQSAGLHGQMQKHFAAGSAATAPSLPRKTRPSKAYLTESIPVRLDPGGAPALAAIPIQSLASMMQGKLSPTVWGTQRGVQLAHSRAIMTAAKEESPRCPVCSFTATTYIQGAKKSRPTPTKERKRNPLHRHCKKLGYDGMPW